MQAFVEFADTMGCKGAKEAIHGRMFAGETINANYIAAQYFPDPA